MQIWYNYKLYYAIKFIVNCKLLVRMDYRHPSKSRDQNFTKKEKEKKREIQSWHYSI